MKQIFNPEIWTVKREKFNPLQWLSKPKAKTPAQPTAISGYELSKLSEVEIVLQRIESHHIDLTCNYEEWIKLGFAFADEFGIAGRNYFHRVSQFHPEYNPTKCDSQFNKCFNGRKSGVTIKSFFFAAHNAGVNVKV